MANAPTFLNASGKREDAQGVFIVDQDGNIIVDFSGGGGGGDGAITGPLAVGAEAAGVRIAMSTEEIARQALLATAAKQDALLAYFQSIESSPFVVLVTPTVTNGAYSAGDIMGGLITFTNVAPAADELILITGAQVAFKAAVMPNPLTLILFNADPTATTKTDNAAYSLNAADVFKVIASVPFQTLGAVHTDHGTPNTIRLDNLGIVCAPVSAGRDIYGLLIDGTGVTLTSTSDVQIRLRGVAA